MLQKPVLALSLWMNFSTRSAYAAVLPTAISQGTSNSSVVLKRKHISKESSLVNCRSRCQQFTGLSLKRESDGNENSTHLFRSLAIWLSEFRTYATNVIWPESPVTVNRMIAQMLIAVTKTSYVLCSGISALSGMDMRFFFILLLFCYVYLIYVDYLLVPCLLVLWLLHLWYHYLCAMITSFDSRRYLCLPSVCYDYSDYCSTYLGICTMDSNHLGAELICQIMCWRFTACSLWLPCHPTVL